MAAAPAPYTVPIGGRGSITAMAYRPAAPEARSPVTLVLAHGAGADQRHRFMTSIASGLAARGVLVVTFNFLYTEQRRHAPDRTAVLEETWRSVMDFTAGQLAPDGALVVGGKSMGGRMASHLVAAPGEEEWQPRVTGLVLLGYPLHPPGKPEALRTSHLPSIRVPVLLVQGTRDAFGTRAEVGPVFQRLPTPVDFEFIEGGDHGFAVPKSSGRTEADVLNAIADRVAAWVRSRREPRT
jgi:uncharacterized protein